ncbi:Thiol-disulfide oxidoreductase ResA [Dyadobacter sp. CECT 9275]|uniref:Thiol-disulfide oxidoreductase ResA n=1 Tax=Dyadobacter helix TaxID=2822344 RepID=A0A916J7N4_9BACT|nr:TlpA disulfide reductase family protein [Dyadobacter sp. CECT 9275]CAG4988389.1 Thiol-disulfide oxidoreductase ResA [Dyadobacter sp. CECT 9275]
MNFISNLILSFLLSASALRAQQGYIIQMNLSGFKNGTQFELVDLNQEKVIDSTRIRDGKLTFRGKVTEPVVGRIHTIDNKYLIVYLENKRITIKGSYADFYYAGIEGSEINMYWVKSRNAQKKYQQTRDSLVQTFMTLGEADSLQMRQIVREMNDIDRWTTHYRKAFINREKPTYFTLKELFYLSNDFSADSLKEVFSRFPAHLQKTKDGVVLSTYISQTGPQIGQPFADIEGRDQAGKKHKLSELKGQYVLLEFWASWCGPCRQENPSTLKTYNLYHKKGFQIYGFSIDANKSSWISAIQKDGLSWLNVSDLGGWHSTEAARYQIKAIPDNFLIDPQGIIIARNLRGNALAEKLRSIYKD